MSLARAHRAINNAKTSAEALNDYSMYLDLQMLEVEVTRLAEASLSDKKRQRSLLSPAHQPKT